MNCVRSYSTVQKEYKAARSYSTAPREYDFARSYTATVPVQLKENRNFARSYSTTQRAILYSTTVQLRDNAILYNTTA